MIRLFIVAVLTCQCLVADESYFALLKEYPETLGPAGDASRGEIEILLDPAKASELEALTGRKVGIVAKDRYWLWLNDPVRFPSGNEGVYGRILNVRGLKGTSGVAVLPVLADGRIALNCNFRHATRSWEYELPRGFIADDETPEQAALREAKEETGLVIGHLEKLGDMAVDSGLTASIVPIFLARVEAQEEASPEESEAIASIDAFTVEELKAGFKVGYLVHKNAEGQEVRIPLRDSFLAFALLS